MAIKFGKKEYVELLLLNKANVNNKFVGDTSPIMVACQQKTERIEILKLLLKYKCNVFLPIGNFAMGDTVIHKAAEMGHFKSIEIIYTYLIEIKCDQKEIDEFFNRQEMKQGQTAYITAVRNRQFEVIDILLRVCKVDGEIPDNSGLKARDILPDGHDKRKWMIELEEKNKLNSTNDDQ